MEKEFIPYEIALALKELGFDEPCIGFYTQNAYGSTLEQKVQYWREPIGGNDDYVFVLAPLYQQAFRWFRERYNVDSWIQPFTSEKSNGVLYLPDESYSYFIFKDGVWVDDNADFSEPKEAELECLKKLIEIVKNK